MAAQISQAVPSLGPLPALARKADVGVDACGVASHVDRMTRKSHTEST